MEQEKKSNSLSFRAAARNLFLCFALALSSLLPAPCYSAEPISRDAEILRLKKTLAEAVMENLKLRYENVRREWKELSRQLGEPDPDAPPSSPSTGEDRGGGESKVKQ